MRLNPRTSFSFLVLLSAWGVLFITFMSFTKKRFSQEALPLVENLELKSETNGVQRTSLRQAASSHNVNSTAVFLLSYQRTGSTFIGGLFSAATDVFYVFEPLDMVYTAMYGVRPGWTVPADIFYTPDGKLRDIPGDEVAAMAWTLERIFRCEVSSLPPMMLLHPFWRVFLRHMPDAGNYVACMDAHGVDLQRQGHGCLDKLKVCPRRFHPEDTRLERCKRALWANGTAWAGEGGAGPDQEFAFRGYFRCLQWYARVARRCAREYMDGACRMRGVRAVKTVRAPGSVAAALLSGGRLPGLRVLHSYRDPRGVVRSRWGLPWAWGHGEPATAPGHGSRYCPGVMRDARHLAAVSVVSGVAGVTTIPRTLTIVYDRFAQDPVGGTTRIYRFLGRPVPQEVRDWVLHQTAGTLTQPGANSTGNATTPSRSSAIAGAWRGFYSHWELHQLNKVCEPLYSTGMFP